MEEAIRRPGRATTREGQASSQESVPVRVLQRVTSPSDLKSLSRDELKVLCQEIRDYIVDVVSQKGGHLGASLGVVELTVALETVLDLPRDKVVWDTGHQAYVHKVLTGRREALWSIRQKDGISGFLKRDESPYDAFGAGHASTAISAALGLATARDLAKQDNKVVAIIGDGAMTGGLAYEALNNAGHSRRRLLVVLNDNGMSISPNVGAMAHYLTSLNASPYLKKLRDEAKHLIERLPVVSEPVGELAKRLESTLKSLVIPGGIFQALGFSYLGPVDGHDLDGLMHLLPNVLQMDGPVLLHVMTRKGKGLQHAEDDHESFHGVSPFDKVTGKAISAPPSPTPAYTKVFGEAMIQAAEAFPEMVAITAAMPTGTGLTAFQKKLPERFFDVGIAEAHGVCFAAGLACEGVRPVCAIYSTFLQRAFDQVVHDVALQELPVVFVLDRAGVVGADGPTHHGVLDLAYLRCVPGMVVAAPRDGNALKDLLWTALSHDGPFALRFPRDTVPAGYDPARPPQKLPIGSWDVLAQGSDAALLAVGTMVQPALAARTRLAARGIDVTVVDCRFVKPLDEELLLRLRREHPVLVTVEEGNLPGGFGDGVLEGLVQAELSTAGVMRLGLPDDFVHHGTREELLQDVGLTPEHLEAAVVSALQKAAVSGRDV
ncbi:MAG TPA: 1-deoxy-D-xylulose-5-phosphate synthase [Candidatus Polarisedimenticolaceae bacterium]|nr:1-deoxy-D-xylulose-5-phosphate synthase [Candidatus Polarisedimenticolaceae bacterium]